MLEEITIQIATTTWVEWLGTISGIIGVWLSIKEKIAAWPLFITCYGAYIALSWQAGLHGALMMNAVFVALSLYGWLSWSKTADTVSTAVRVGRTPPGKLFIALGIWAAGTVGLGYFLANQTGAYRPYLDAFASCGGFVAQWMLSRKYIETWICWTISDLIFIGLWLSQGYWLTVGLFLVFIGMAVKGWAEWSGLLKAPAPDTAS